MRVSTLRGHAPRLTQPIRQIEVAAVPESFPAEVLPLLEGFKKIYLWMDHDTPGLEAVPKFVKKVGVGRTCVVSGATMDEDGRPKVYKDANDALREGANLKAMIEAAKPQPHEQILSFNQMRDELYHNLMYPEQHAGRQSTTLPKLDAILKGHRRGEMTVCHFSLSW